VYFDNVGGPILDAVLGRLATNARVVLCGVISSYLSGEQPGPGDYVNLLSKTSLMQGFNTLSQWGHFTSGRAGRPARAPSYHLRRHRVVRRRP
jgi:NADPH-dependent curcumin reductase CurA